VGSSSSGSTAPTTGRTHCGAPRPRCYRCTKVRIGSIVNLLDTQIALVEADEGIAIIPSFGIPECPNRKVVVSQLVNPVVRFDFHLISSRGRDLPPGADEFASFLKSYVAIWAGRAGVL
jgi:LysR family transcriptional regulator, carnitine catabolism transcriptional activator